MPNESAMTEALQRVIAELCAVPERWQDEFASEISGKVEELWVERVLPIAQKDALREDGSVDTEVLGASWDFTAHLLYGFDTLYGLIAELRKRGYDRHFRAGQSLHYFILSRSRKYGL